MMDPKMQLEPPVSPAHRVVRAVLITIASVPAIYLIVAIVLALIPMWRNPFMVGAYQMNSSYHLLSPDGKTNFTASRNGRLLLIDTKSGRTLSERHLDLPKYSSISARWGDIRHLEVGESYRYPGLMSGGVFTWDSVSGQTEPPSSNVAP